MHAKQNESSAKKIALTCVLVLCCLAGSADSRSACDLLVNQKKYLDEQLFSSSNQEITFGLPITNKLSVPIGYSIDVECGIKNSSKLRTTLTFDIQKVPVEINYLNCDGVLFIEKVNFTQKPQHDQLKFMARFKAFKNISSEIKMSLNLNRRYSSSSFFFCF